MIRPGIGAALVAAFCCGAVSADPPAEAFDADIVLLGEQHDNPEHHARQAEWVHALAPRALVFEMLTPEQASAIADERPQDEKALDAVLGWADSGWPDFAMYYPIFAAAPEARVFGAGVGRETLQGLRDRDLAELAGPEGARFGLDADLPEAQQADRMALQRAAHCDALPEDLLPMMVSAQRLRDAALAGAALDAIAATGGPVVVITGNGHVRADWGATALLRKAAPELGIFALGQGENGEAPEGSFDAVEDAAPVDRGDPCEAFVK
ncbi:ChaN family lipoprotein [Sulfitobacter sp. LCG007]